MVELELKVESTFISITNDYGSKIAIDFPGFHRLQNDRRLLLEPLVEHMNMLEILTAKTIRNRLVWIDEAFCELKLRSLPSHEDEWSSLVLKIHEYIFTTANRKCSLQSRGKVWTSVHQILTIWQVKEIIPKPIQFPSTRKIPRAEVEKYSDQLIGQKPLELATTFKIEKLVGSFDISMTDEDFLESFESKLTAAREGLHSVLLDYWRVIKANYEFGKKLIAAVDLDSLVKECYHYKSMGMKNHPCDLRNGIEGLKRWLALSKYHNNNFLVNEKVRAEWIKSGHSPTSPAQTFTPKYVDSKNSKYLRQGEFLQEHIFSNLDFPPNFITKNRLKNPQCSEPRHTLNWMLGNLSTVDVGVICGLLIMLNPQFTPHSILNAKITDKNKNDYFVKLDGVSKFSIEKSRAKQMKTSILDETSSEIISTILEMTEFRRELLEKVNSKAADLLFLPLNTRTNELMVGKFGLVNQLLSGSCSRAVWLGDYFPELESLGLSRGTITASKIRATEGVLEWFRTGSISAMSKKLGNSHKVAIEHYLPKALLNVWNTRLVRRFQNLWIAVAAADEPFILEVTDFRTLEELHCFINDMLNCHKSGSSPLADELHRRFTNLTRVVLDDVDQSTALHIEVSESNLSVLYTYYLSALKLNNSEVLSRIDSVTKQSPKHFVDIARLLIHKLPNHNDPALKQAHFSAFSAAEKWAEKLNWANLLLAGS